MPLAPVILFAYNRPDHTQRTLNALAENSLAGQSELFIFLDGAKTGADEPTRQAIAAVRKIADAENRFLRQTVIASESNQGLAKSVISGVTRVINEHGRAIVLEDDLISSPAFLSFMNEALERYARQEAVSCISGYVYPLSDQLPSTYFIKGADCWGWATWKRAWDRFEQDGKKLYAELAEKKLFSDFDFFDSFPYTKMLEDQIAGKNSSWAIRWYASAFLQDMLTLYPARSFIHNIGIDGSGTHSGKHNYWHIDTLATEYHFPDDAIQENLEAKRSFARYFQQLSRKSFTRHLRHMFNGLLRKLRG